MHILLLPSWYPSHSNDVSGVFFRQQALALKRHGHQIGVICVSHRSLRDWRSIVNGQYGVFEINDEEIPTYRCHGMNWFPRLGNIETIYYKHYAWRLYQRYTDTYGHPDLIHVHSMLNAGILAYGVLQKHNVPYVVTEHSSRFAKKKYTRYQKSLCQEISSKASRRFAVSESFTTLLEQDLTKNTDKWECIPNMVDNRFLQQALPIPKNKKNHFLFTTIATLTEKKGLTNLLRAFSQAFSNDPSVYLQIGGHGPDRSKLESLADSLGIKKQVRFLGLLRREEVCDAMRAADAFVLPSHYETFGVVVIEALALGKPVIATRCGGPENIVRPEDGILVPVNDVSALAVAMKEMRNNSNRFHPEIIRQACFERYSESAVIRRLNQAYQKVIRL